MTTKEERIQEVLDNAKSLYEAREGVKRITAQISDDQEVLVRKMLRTKIESVEFESEEVMVTGTLVTGSETLTLDEDGIIGELPPAVKRKVTKTILDKGKLEDAVARGLVDPDIIARHSTFKPIKDHVRFTKKKS